ncbi:MAG: DUF1743 domain-containing protein [Methanobacteriota archaeon]|nr:MAG: DUF1743 domain-containing protein [Euryarchaeota archaeon]
MAATLLAFDDTDSPDGMCTTYLAVLMLRALSRYDLLGLPRLVRLNPNVPWKTRGNAAICLPLGRGVGVHRQCGAVEGTPIAYFDRGTPADPKAVLKVAEEVLEREAEFGCDNTNPGIVCTRCRPPQTLYWQAVRGIVTLGAVESQLTDCGADWKKYKNGRGVIGAASAASWRPRDRTWEVIAYRDAALVGTPRDIDTESVIAMDQGTSYTFNNYDYETHHIAIAPASPCPVLYGIRGDSPEELLKARTMIRGEAPASWLLFLTNQGTDDHIVRRRIGELSSGQSACVQARVIRPPRTIAGGHVILGITDGSEIDAAFYEPSGSLRAAARRLIPGDHIVVHGSIRDEPRSINVEKMQILHLTDRWMKSANPTCPDCDKRMGSLGAGQGYRCKICGKLAPESSAERVIVPREVARGWYEPTVASRRHLYKPIRRMPRGDVNSLL